MTSGSPGLPLLCRDCLEVVDAPAPSLRRCPSCGGHRLLRHRELHELHIAHLDCDAFYASVEKRDDPSLRDRPVIVGGGRRGVVSAACYVARLYGVRSAMPMFKALAACPDAVVRRPDIPRYRAVAEEIRARMLALTPLVEPLSLDEAFLDLSGTTRLHGGSPARSLARLARDIERDLGLTVSIGLAPNKLLAKIASELDKPRGFAVIGRAEAVEFLGAQPVSILWGVGGALKASLEKNGIRQVRDLLPYSEAELVARYGTIGRRLHSFARAEDVRRIEPEGAARSISAETTFEHNLSDLQALRRELWPLCEKVASRLKRAELGTGGVALKLKGRDFRQITRSRRLATPTQLAEVLFRETAALLASVADGTSFRLIGVGTSDLCAAELADPPDLLEPDRARSASVERAIDALRAKLGPLAVQRGRSFRPAPAPGPKAPAGPPAPNAAAEADQQPGSGSASISTRRARNEKSP